MTRGPSRNVFAGSVVQLSKSDERDFRKLCKKLLKYARYALQFLFVSLLSNLLKTPDPVYSISSIEEIINLAIEDPLVRLVLARFDLEYYLSSSIESAISFWQQTKP